MDNHDAHACTRDTTDNRVWPLPFAGESQGEPFGELSCFTPDQPIGGDDKRSGVLALFKTGLQVILLLVLLRGQDLMGVSGPIRLAICISHADVNNNIRPTGPEASNEEISPLFDAWGLGLLSLSLLSSASGMDHHSFSL
jgi:hypothetical protein